MSKTWCGRMYGKRQWITLSSKREAFCLVLAVYQINWIETILCVENCLAALLLHEVHNIIGSHSTPTKLESCAWNARLQNSWQCIINPYVQSLRRQLTAQWSTAFPLDGKYGYHIYYVQDDYLSHDSDDIDLCIYKTDIYDLTIPSPPTPLGFLRFPQLKEDAESALQTVNWVVKEWT